jgi:hypothetical protein
MKGDDYLWDGSGEVDEEIERLEKTLAPLRFKAQPLALPRAPRRNLRLLAAAAAVVMVVAAGLWIYLNGHQPAPQIADRNPSVDQTQAPERAPDHAMAQSSDQSVHENVKRTTPRKRRRASPRDESNEILAVASSPYEIGKHIESAQLLLRAFKNISEDDRVDVSYERSRSRRLLQQNILLRRSVEARGNLPLGETLGALEPFLLDIANLPETPSRAEMSGIRQRIEKREIIATLQVYSMVGIVN